MLMIDPYTKSCYCHLIPIFLHNAQMKAFYERLKSKGRHTTLVQIAVMRKLVVVAHSLYKSGEIYNKELYKMTLRYFILVDIEKLSFLNSMV